MSDDDWPYDDRVADDVKATVSRSREEADRLAQQFPQDQYPTVESESDMWRRAGEECVQHNRNGGSPPEMFRSLIQAAEDEGMVPVIIVAEETAIYPDDEGAVRLTTSETNGVEHMAIEDLGPDELATLMQDVDPDALAHSMVELVGLRDDITMADGLLSVWELSDKSLVEMCGEMLDAGYSAEEMHAAVDAAKS